MHSGVFVHRGICALWMLRSNVVAPLGMFISKTKNNKAIITVKYTRYTSKKVIFYDNFVSFWMRHSKHSCHIGPFSYHIGHFLSFWTVSQKTMFSTSNMTLHKKGFILFEKFIVQNLAQLQ